MKPKTYVQKALRTESKNYHKSKRLSPRIEHAVFGLVTEAGELLDKLKRVRFYNTEIDRVNLAEEIGDIMWYLAIFCDELGVSFEEVWVKNIKKLKARYPKAYAKEKALKRNLTKERRVLEGRSPSPSKSE